ncbi:MAG: glycoside hydrolase family 32 protein [Maribacter sp.]|nr:glycoside hydrolase family 32 protein [Maribacter sp.]
MKFKLHVIVLITVLLVLGSCKNKQQKTSSTTDAAMKAYYDEPFRPQFHFSPEEKWMNDPNGMVFHQGVYHLFYQYYPDDIVWGPMHWGHAVSEDLIYWEHKPIALYPDEHGLIFSGSAVVDKDNSSGFGTMENPPLVAIYTYHLVEGEKEGRNDFQTQGIAYSLDNGDSWTKYNGNPVIGNEGIKDFRDPKVVWDEESQKWIMTLVAGDHAKFYSSDDLKEWILMSEFGKNLGAHGGVWECPDLFKLKVEDSNEEKWVLLISINPGAPNGGSGTQYFIGDFDGRKFTTDQKAHLWLDWGTDNYAGVTYSNFPNGDRVFIGWMSNWLYAQNTPTEKWRSAMTLPRKLTLKKIAGSYRLFNFPLDGFNTIVSDNKGETLVLAEEAHQRITSENLNQSEIRFTTSSKDFQLKFSNGVKDELLLTMLREDKTFFIDRSNSGIVDFQEDFGNEIQQMPVPDLPEGEYEVRVFLDRSSIEIFINKGQYVMTAQIFPKGSYTDLQIENLGDSEITMQAFSINEVQRIWE